MNTTEMKKTYELFFYMI